jgi:hypothetical protein
MIVQFNLLPDVKIEYLRAKRQQHVVMLASIFITAVSVAVFLLLVSVVYGVQKKSINDLNGDIKSTSSKLTQITDLDKILTVQNQLKSLPDLHNSKVVSSRLYGYLSQVTPITASLNKLSVDYGLGTMSIKGSANDLVTVNTYVDTLKFTRYTVKGKEGQTAAFSEVVLSQFSRNEKEANFEISLRFDATIFKVTEDVELVVPQIITTRSEVDKPTALFQPEGGQ